MEQGRLAWLNSDGSEKLLTTTADQFKPANGAVVSLNGHTFSADMRWGKWVRKGNLWHYRTFNYAEKQPFHSWNNPRFNRTKRDRFTLDLNFDNNTWSFTGKSKNLDQDIKVADGGVRVELDLQGSHRFTQWLEHDVASTWRHHQREVAWAPYGIHEIEGAYYSEGEQGHIRLDGHIPKGEKQFGDMKIIINGAPISVPLLKTQGFLEKLQSEGVASYETEGLFFYLDFYEGKWQAYVYGDQFNSGMVPKGGEMHVQVFVGGTVSSDETFQIKQHSTSLTYGQSANGAVAQTLARAYRH